MSIDLTAVNALFTSVSNAYVASRARPIAPTDTGQIAATLPAPALPPSQAKWMYGAGAAFVLLIILLIVRRKV